MALEATVQGAPTQSEGIRGPTDVAVVAHERLFDQDPLGFIEGELAEVDSGIVPRSEREVAHVDHASPSHENGPLDCMLQLTHVSRPRVSEERLGRLIREAQELLPVVRCLTSEKVKGEGGDVLSPVTQGRPVILAPTESRA